MRVNGKRAIGIGVASGAKDNVVAVGKAVDERLAEIEQLLPIGLPVLLQQMSFLSPAHASPVPGSCLLYTSRCV